MVSYCLLVRSAHGSDATIGLNLTACSSGFEVLVSLEPCQCMTGFTTNTCFVPDPPNVRLQCYDTIIDQPYLELLHTRLESLIMGAKRYCYSAFR